MGELLAWDRADASLGSRVPSLRGWLPADLRKAPSGPDNDDLRDFLFSQNGSDFACDAVVT